MASGQSKIAVVTGAGSGVGRAVAVRLAAEDWDVALVGRTVSSLEETVRLCGNTGSRLLVVACDVADEPSVRAMAKRVRDELGDASVLVNSAGINVPRRSFEKLSNEDFRRILDTNLAGAFFCKQAFLAGMRRAGAGTIVNVGSEAGLFGNSVSGPAYIASKFGLTGLTEAINAEEHRHGIRACIISPGVINTPMVDLRPSPPDAASRQHMLQPEDVADCVMLAINLPQRASIQHLLIRPTDLGKL